MLATLSHGKKHVLVILATIPESAFKNKRNKFKNLVECVKYPLNQNNFQLSGARNVYVN